MPINNARDLIATTIRHCERDLIATTIRHCERATPFMPGAVDRVLNKIGSHWLTDQTSWDAYLEQLTEAINGEKLTIERLKAVGVDMKVLVGWQWWAIFRDEII